MSHTVRNCNAEPDAGLNRILHLCFALDFSALMTSPPASQLGRSLQLASLASQPEVPEGRYPRHFVRHRLKIESSQLFSRFLESSALLLPLCFYVPFAGAVQSGEFWSWD